MSKYNHKKNTSQIVIKKNWTATERLLKKTRLPVANLILGKTHMNNLISNY